MPTTILDGETHQTALARRMREEAAFDQTVAQQHTQEPWVVNGDFIRGTDGGNSPTGYEYIAKASTEWLDSPIDRKPANARRIVACVNACKGIATETLEISDETLNELFKRNCAEYQTQRDELLSALKTAEMAMLGYTHRNDVITHALNVARTAIANAEGEI